MCLYKTEYDVVVSGGGVSGCAAAVSAARLGAKVILIEQNAFLGGTLTACGVGPMMTFHAGEKQVIKGFMQEVVDKLVNLNYSPGHVPDTKQYTDTVTPFASEGLKLVLDEMLVDSGCTVLYHTFTGAVSADNGKINNITVCNKDGINTITGKVFIDATGDGDIAAWSGAPMTKGRPEDGASQPMTLKMKYCGVDTAKLKKHVLDNISDFPAMEEHKELFKQDIPIDLEGFNKEVSEAKKAGELSIARENILLFGTNNDGEYIINTTRVIDHDSTDALSLSKAEIAGRKQCAELDRFLRKNVPGFEKAILEFTGPSIGVRSSRQLKGIYTLKAEDILNCREFNSVICHSGYPIDIHNPKGEGTSSTFLRKRGSYYSIPYEIMVCEEIKNLIVTGRCVSATFEAQASVRLTPSCGSMGQAAGVAAAQATAKDIHVKDINVSEMQNNLINQGAYLEIPTI